MQRLRKGAKEKSSTIIGALNIIFYPRLNDSVGQVFAFI
jgi:hypothetical protein